MDALGELTKQPGEATALVIHGQACSYRELVAGAQRWCGTLDATGVQPGAAIALTGESCCEMVMLLLALTQHGNTAVPFLSSSEAETELALRTAQVDGVFRFDATGRAEWRPRAAGRRHELLERLRESGRPGLILFTSGSTGASKAALHDFSRIWNRCARAERKMGSTLVFLMIDHIGGINTLLHVLLCGGTAVFPMDRSVAGVCRAIEAHRVELLPTTPTFLNMLLLSDHRNGFDMSSLRMITYGTEPIPPTTLLGVKRAFPHVRCKQTYGMTEIGILPTRSEADDSVWLKVGGPGFETRVVEGVLWIRAETSMLGYLNAPSPFDAAGWLNTGDLVETRAGMLRIRGRSSELINVAGEKASPTEIEDVILQVDNIDDVVVTPKSNPITGQVVVAVVRLRSEEDHRAVAARVRQHCLRLLSPYKVPALVQVTQSDLIGRRFKKIRRPDDLLPSGLESGSVS